MNVCADDYRTINPKPVLMCAFGNVVLSPILWDNVSLRPFLIARKLVVLKDGVPFTRDVSHFVFSRFITYRGGDVESLKRFLRSNIGDYESLLCLFFDVAPPDSFVSLCKSLSISVEAFCFSLESVAYKRVFP
ncbi:MAG: hypothetical protein IPK84_00425 [Candidatus Moraniibacteriota bacterium]|nr:MAG: hypothetical protein IPK84_00425 [Candidatus Moranbacteria bacterium]